MADNMQDAMMDDEEEDFEKLLDQHLPKAAPKVEGELLDATVVGVVSDAVLVTYGSKEEVAISIEEFRGPNGEVTVKPGDSIRALMMGWDEDGEPQLSYKKARAAEAGKMLEEAAEAKVPVRGVIVRALATGVLVDVGVQAFMPASHIDLFRVNDLSALVGQEVEAYVLEYDARKGRAVLSRRELLKEHQDKDRQAFLANVVSGSEIDAVVREVLDFGVFVTMGPTKIEGMIPRSEMTYDRGVAPSDLVKPGERIKVKVLDVSPENGKITLSRKRLNEDPWLKIDEYYPVNTTVSGKVVSIQEFGAFVQLQEGITGLIHAKDISWERERKSAKETFHVGDTVTCFVSEIDKEHKRLGLSVKHLARDPWMDVADKYPVGSKHKGVVSSLRDFGAFVKLDEFTDALLHIGDLTYEKRIGHPSELLTDGQEVEVVILNLDTAKRRISVGMKQTAASPYDRFLQEHPVGSLAKGKVSRLVPFGAFLELAPGLEGLIHISELDDNRVDSPERVVHVGDEVQVKILEANKDKGRIGLSRKQAFHELEQENIRQYMKDEDQKSAGATSAFAAAMKAAQDKKSAKK